MDKTVAIDAKLANSEAFSGFRFEKIGLGN